ncbi:MAG: hypothetical protein WB975_04315, partial [Nitrososphaeraceae archaeon]
MTNLDFEHTYWSFLQTWKAAVEDPEKQIFSVSHYNVIDYILEYGKVNLYEKNLLTNIVNGLK